MLLKPSCIEKKKMIYVLFSMKNVRKYWEKKLCSVSQENDSPSTTCSQWSQTHSLSIMLRTFLFSLLWIRTELPISLAHLAKCGGRCSQNNHKKFICVGLQTFKYLEADSANNRVYANIAFWEGCTQILKVTTWCYRQIYMLSACLWFKALPFIEEKHLAIFRGRANENVKRNH